MQVYDLSSNFMYLSKAIHEYGAQGVTTNIYQETYENNWRISKVMVVSNQCGVQMNVTQFPRIHVFGSL